MAKKMGAKLQPASGAMSSAKSDAKAIVGVHKFRIENKSTVKDTMSVELGWLAKISHEASQDASIPVLTISFVTPEGKPRMPRNADWVCMPLVNFQELMDEVGGPHVVA
jgi:hypothetical protein